MPPVDCLKFPVLPATTKVMSVCSRGAWFAETGMRQETDRPKVNSKDLKYMSFIILPPTNRLAILRAFLQYDIAELDINKCNG